MYRLLLILSILLFLGSLFLPVYAEKPELYGLYALLAGWMTGLNDIPTAVSWLANVTYVFSILFFLRKKKPKALRSFIFGVLSIILSLGFLMAGKAFTGFSETVGKLTPGTAYYAWLGSFVAITAAAWMKHKSKQAPVQPQNPETVDDVTKS